MTSRASFLSRLRPRPAPAGPAAPVPEVRYRDLGDPVATFQARWRALGGEAHETAAANLAAVLEAIVAGRAPLLLGADPLLAGCRGDLRWPDCGVAGAATAQVAAVGATAAVAATGSVVLDARALRGRAAVLLAPVAVFLVRRATVVATPGDVLRRPQERWPDGLPSELVLVTGPSRSADIEMTLVRGVHGPGEAHAIIVEEEERSR